jgi:hypothetical protein
MQVQSTIKAEPPNEQQIAPRGTNPIIFDTFAGLNTNASRPGIADDECSWMDGFMPLGKNNLRTLPGVGPSIYTSPAGVTIVCFAFANIGTAPVCIVFLSDGSIVQVNIQSGFAFQIAAAGTILSPSQQNVGVSQWGNQFILIVANQTNGYFIWNGGVLFRAGTIGALVNVTNSGLNYTSQPTFIVETTGGGSGATFNAILNNDVIQEIDVGLTGGGYGINDFVNLVIQGGGSDNTARATATIGPGGGIQTVAVLNGGGGYAFGTSATAVGGGGTGAELLVMGLVPDGGANNIIQSITVLSPGTGYTSAPTIQLHNVGNPTSTATFAVSIFEGVITAINVTDPGTGYVTPPTVSLIGDGTGGSFIVQINSSGQITGIVVKDGGQGYTKALVKFSGGNNAAEGDITIMPFGIQGTWAETYVSRAWVANGNKISFTAADSLQDFATSDGGGTIQATDSFLRNSYTVLRQTNGFLYILADSSENYISGVTTSGVPPTTTFNNQNADPEVGTSWPYTVQVFNRNILFANSFGVHVSYGGAVTKISEDLDGIYNTVFNFGGFIPSSAKAIIYGKRVFMLLLPVVDIISGQTVNKLFMWNGKKWFSSQQDVPLTFVASQELNSVLTAWGTDGTHIYPLFQKPSTGFNKVVQSKLWDKPNGYMFNKTDSRLWGLFYFRSLAGSSLSISVDNENGASSSPIGVGGPLVGWVNALAVVVTWANAIGNTNVLWTNSGVGIVVMQPTAVGQQGALVGLTLTTNAADMTVISLAVEADNWNYRG